MQIVNVACGWAVQHVSQGSTIDRRGAQKFTARELGASHAIWLAC